MTSSRSIIQRPRTRAPPMAPPMALPRAPQMPRTRLQPRPLRPSREYLAPARQSQRSLILAEPLSRGPMSSARSSPFHGAAAGASTRTSPSRSRRGRRRCRMGNRRRCTCDRWCSPGLQIIGQRSRMRCSKSSFWLRRLLQPQVTALQMTTSSWTTRLATSSARRSWAPPHRLAGGRRRRRTRMVPLRRARSRGERCLGPMCE
mmetsp:Transcript_101317/g.290679  ORF Transcript_101317/g.290679 Transcript_101317/m.290679 type:complete len:203 (+) Transcript_101317:646-1254(+)